MEGRRRARRTILAPPCASRPAAPPCRRVRAAVAQTPPSERAPPHRAHTARGVGRDACCDGAWRPSTASIAPLIYQPPPPVRRSAPTPPSNPATARAAREGEQAFATCTRLLRPPQSARLASREIWCAGARGVARGEATYRTPAPRRSRAPSARAPRRTSASSRRALSQSPNTLRSGSCPRAGAGIRVDQVAENHVLWLRGIQLS